ncbi:TonB-dependent receptor, partial [Mariniphaga sediminis]|uniref:TonB-dependent receptor n=1 Tax=Mariniphaga sediminis TaxID=1628158 RepID=UPI003564EEC6
MKKNVALYSKYLVKTLSVLILIVFNVSIMFAQSMVSGVVTDGNDGTALPSANVYVEGTTNGTITNLNGEYRLLLGKGSYTIMVSFVGYTSQKEVITIVDGKATNLNFQLSPEPIMGEEIIVTAMQRGQRAAISTQLNAAGIINSVSEEQIQELPDANAGESIGRLPGISLKRSGGEAEKIVLRGLNEKFSKIQLDGVAIPATDAGSRGVDLSLFSVNSLAGIEVTKALTSDMDADAIAGLVNLITKKASEKPELRFDLGGGYNKLANSAAQYSLGVRYSRRLFNNFLGVQVSSNHESKIRSNESYRVGWIVDPDSTYQISSLSPSYTKERRTRTGGSLLFDVNLSKGGAIRLNNFFSRTDRNAINYSRSYNTSDNVGYSLTDSERNIQTYNSSLAGEHFMEKIKVNWDISHALSINKLPYQHSMNFTEGGSVGAGMQNIPNDVLQGPAELLIPYAYNNFDVAYLRTAFFQTSKNRDRNVSTHIDFERLFSISDKVNITLKAGGKYRAKSRSNDIELLRSPYYLIAPSKYQRLDDGSIVPSDFSGTSFEDLIMVGGANISMSNFLADNPPSRGLYDGKYDLNPLIDKNLVREWYETHKNGISADGTLEEYSPYSSVIPQLYSLTERISSAYVMATINLGEMIRVIGGVRIEKEDNDYTAKYAPDLGNWFGFDPNKVGDTLATYTSTFILPNVHLRFKPVKWWDLRLAATKTLARPDFSMRLPTLVVNRVSGGAIQRGRPDLKTT